MQTRPRHAHSCVHDLKHPATFLDRPGCSLRLLLAGLLAAMAGSAPAQTAYRCEIGARTVYQAAPCDGGKRLDIADPRTDDQRAQAQRSTELLESAGARMAREHQARERALLAASKPARGREAPAHAKAAAPERRAKAEKPLRFRVAAPNTAAGGKPEPGSRPKR